MPDAWKNLLAQKTVIVALCMYGVGAFLHYRGRNLSTDSTAQIQQFLGLLFDLVASLVIAYEQKHQDNKQRIQQTAKGVVLNADAIKTATGTSPLESAGLVDAIEPAAAVPATLPPDPLPGLVATPPAALGPQTGFTNLPPAPGRGK